MQENPASIPNRPNRQGAKYTQKQQHVHKERKIQTSNLQCKNDQKIFLSFHDSILSYCAYVLDNI